MFFLRRICSSRPGRLGTAQTERGSSHSSWKGSRLLVTPATAACLTSKQTAYLSLPCKRESSTTPFVSPFPTKWPLCGDPNYGRTLCVQTGRAAHGAFPARRKLAASGSSRAPCAFSQPAVLSALLVIQLFGIVIPPPYFPKEHQKERCGHSRSQRSFITFHGALRNILLSAGFPAMFHMIVLEQTFVNALLQNFFLLLLLNRIDQ